MSKAAQQERIAKMREAHRLLTSLKSGDSVTVTDAQGRSYQATITDGHLGEVMFGSWESYTVGASLGPGRHTFDLTPHKLANGELTVTKN